MNNKRVINIVDGIPIFKSFNQKNHSLQFTSLQSFRHLHCSTLMQIRFTGESRHKITTLKQTKSCDDTLCELILRVRTNETSNKTSYYQNCTGYDPLDQPKLQGKHFTCLPAKYRPLMDWYARIADSSDL